MSGLLTGAFQHWARSTLCRLGIHCVSRGRQMFPSQKITDRHHRSVICDIQPQGQFGHYSSLTGTAILTAGERS
jgi:hypothetical protein